MVDEGFARHDVVGESARAVIDTALPTFSPLALERTVAQLVGPALFRVLSANSEKLPTREPAASTVMAAGAPQPTS